MACWQDLARCCLSVLPHKGSSHSRATGDLLPAQDCLILKGISLVSLAPCLQHQVSSDAQAPAEPCLPLTGSVSSPFWILNYCMETKRILCPGRSQGTANSGQNGYAEVNAISLPHCQVHPQNPSLVNSSSANMYWARIPNNTLCGWM